MSFKNIFTSILLFYHICLSLSLSLLFIFPFICVCHVFVYITRWEKWVTSMCIIVPVEKRGKGKISFFRHHLPCFIYFVDLFVLKHGYSLGNLNSSMRLTCMSWACSGIYVFPLLSTYIKSMKYHVWLFIFTFTHSCTRKQQKQNILPTYYLSNSITDLIILHTLCILCGKALYTEVPAVK